MPPEEQRALLAVALLAAFADGDKSEAEREEVKRIASTLGDQTAGLNIPALMQDVLLKRLGVRQALAALKARRNTASWPTSWPCVSATPTACRRRPSASFSPA
jgi:DnaJ-domain-containing protein 1